PALPPPGAGGRCGIWPRRMGAVFITRAAFMGHDDRAVVRRQPVEVTVGDRDQHLARCPLIRRYGAVRRRLGDEPREVVEIPARSAAGADGALASYHPLGFRNL